MLTCVFNTPFNNKVINSLEQELVEDFGEGCQDSNWTITIEIILIAVFFINRNDGSMFKFLRNFLRANDEINKMRKQTRIGIVGTPNVCRVNFIYPWSRVKFQVVNNIFNFLNTRREEEKVI